MSYRIRFTMPDGRTGLWACDYPTREDAQRAIDDRLADTGFSYAVEEVTDAPDPGSTAAHHVEILRAIDDRLADIGLAYSVEGVPDAPEPGSMAEHHVEILRKRVEEMVEVNNAIHRDLAFAIQIGDAMREAMRTGEWRAGHDRSMASSAIAGWDRFKPSLAAAPSVPVGASEAPGEGGDSDRMRLEDLRAFLEGNEDASITWREGEFSAVAEGGAVMAPTLAALADKLAEREAKP